jgi:hypothetical protein
MKLRTLLFLLQESGLSCACCAGKSKKQPEESRTKRVCEEEDDYMDYCMCLGALQTQLEESRSS